MFALLLLAHLLFLSGDGAPGASGRRGMHNPGPVEERLIYTVVEAATLLGVSKWTYYEAAKKGLVPVTRLGKRLVVPKVQLEMYLAGQWAKPA